MIEKSAKKSPKKCAADQNDLEGVEDTKVGEDLVKLLTVLLRQVARHGAQLLQEGHDVATRLWVVLCVRHDTCHVKCYAYVIMCVMCCVRSNACIVLRHGVNDDSGNDDN